MQKHALAAEQFKVQIPDHIAATRITGTQISGKDKTFFRIDERLHMKFFCLLNVLQQALFFFDLPFHPLFILCDAALHLVASAQFGKRFLQSAGPEWGTRVGAGCFFLMGTLKIFEELRKRRRKKQGKTEARPEHLEKQLHPLEFGLLAVSMSVDGIVSGVFAADLPVTGGQIFFASFAVGMAAMYAGTAIGKKTGQKNGGNGALFGGILFYLLAFLKLT